MAQTQDAISAKDLYVALSNDDGASWTDISGFAGSVVPGGGERQIGEAFTFDGEKPIVKPGKLAMLELVLNIVYTEGADEAYDMVESAYESGEPLMVRWSPAGGLEGDKGYVSDSQTYVISPPYAGGEAEDPNPIMFEATFNTLGVTPETITSTDPWATA